MSIRVFLVDDHALVRSGLAQVIDAEPDMEVIGQDEGTAVGIEAIRRLQPQVVVLDLEMPRMRGADFITRLRSEVGDVGILVCTMHAAHGYVAEALRRGANGYVLKSSPAAEMVEAIRSVAQGKGYIDPALQTDVIRLLKDRGQRLAAEELTAQELEVLRLAAQGLTNQEIAKRTRQSVETVKLRLRRCFQKLGASDRAHAVALAMRRNLI